MTVHSGHGRQATQDSALRERIINVLHTIVDPEMPVNISELGLIYGVWVSGEGDVEIAMTLTSAGCPVGGAIPAEVEAKVAALPGVRSVQVQVVWDPPWSPERMSEAARLYLDL